MRKGRGALASAGLALGLAIGIVHAQGTLQRCVAPDGRVTYQDKKCDVGAKVTGEVQRDRSRPDPAALQRASDERARADRFAAARAKANVAEDERRAKAEESEAKERAWAEADARARAAAEPRYYYVPYGIVVPQAKPAATAGTPSAILQPPGILDTPAPCKTLQCQQRNKK